MPALESDFVRTPSQTITIALEPVQNLLNSLMLLHKAEELPGVNEWVLRSALMLSPEQRRRNRLVLEGLHYAVKPSRRWSSFPAYIDHLEHQRPTVLRDQVLSAYTHLCCDVDTRDIAPENQLDLLASLETFLGFLRTGFPPEVIDVDIETEAYALLSDPLAMRSMIVSHLRQMWTEILEPEWKRDQPLLQASVDAFRQIDFNSMPVEEAARQIMGQELPEKWVKMLQESEFEQVIFVPSAHLGPYRGIFKGEGLLWLIFNARLPEGSQIVSDELSRSDLLVRLSALTDDTRLQILHALKETKEQCSKDIMEELDLSQSAASRHLKQLSATGYLSERRKNGSKCYSLNEERIEDTLHALSNYLLG